MHGLFFDVRPKPGHMKHYFSHVDRLRPILEGHPGLEYLERFRPLDEPEALLSHQLWADEASLAAWRKDATHRASQSAGRKVHFDGYRIRVGPQQPIPQDRGAGPAHEARYLVAVYGSAPAGIGRAYRSVTRPERFLTLIETGSDREAAKLAADATAPETTEVRVFNIARDYTMTDRREAPA